MQRRTLIAGALGLPVAAALWQFTSAPAQANYSPVCSAANNAEGQPILGAMHGDHWAFTTIAVYTMSEQKRYFSPAAPAPTFMLST